METREVTVYFTGPRDIVKLEGQARVFMSGDGCDLDTFRRVGGPIEYARGYYMTFHAERSRRV